MIQTQGKFVYSDAGLRRFSEPIAVILLCTSSASMEATADVE
jgi:hypothetical protein